MPQENRQDRPQTPEDERSGGYGDDTALAGEAQAAPQGDSAVGRENPAAGSTDADEALGNRVGGYGRGPEEEETD